MLIVPSGEKKKMSECINKRGNIEFTTVHGIYIEIRSIRA